MDVPGSAPNTFPALLIQTELDKLVGLPAWGAAFAADMLMLQFGDRHLVAGRNGMREVGDHALHVQVRWRFATPEQILVGAADLWLDDEADNSPAIAAQIRSILAASPTVVRAHRIFAAAFALELQGGVYLEVFPSARHTADAEFWRLLMPATSGRHFVVSASGINQLD